MQHQINFLELVEELRPFVTEINVAALKQKTDKRETIQLIDVREDQEWAHGHIPGAIHLARGVIERDIGNEIANKETNIVLYCSGGFRSVLSAYNLQKMGYCNVASLSGGLKEWLMNGFSLDKD